MSADIVSIDFHWGPDAVAPIWAHYWGDGTYMGADLLMSVKAMRSRIAANISPFGYDGGLIHRKLLKRLSRARIWTVVVTDAAGKTRSSATFPVPIWQEAEAAFLKARSGIDAMELSYRNLNPLTESEASCTAHEDPAGIVRIGEPARSDRA